MWHAFSGEVQGLAVRGDEKVPATTWWNKPLLVLFVWKTVQVFEVPAGEGPYRVGFIPLSGKAEVRDEPVTGRRFAVRIGREDCRFFALDDHGSEIDLKKIGRLHKKDLPADVVLV